MKLLRTAVTPLGLALGLLGAALVPISGARADWPERPVSVIVPWAAGGGTDPLARVIFDNLSKRLGQPFVLSFQPGASGTVGTAAAARAEPDGYTVLFTSGGPTVNANFMPNVAYDPKTDIVPVAQVTQSPLFIVANANTPYNSFDEFIEYAKAHPGKVNAALSGIGGVSHVAASTIQHIAGVELNMVPYTGSGGQLADLMSGVVDVGFGFAAGFIPGVQSGKLKFIAAMSSNRDVLMPDVPATDESAYKGIYSGTWFMALAPKGTPQDVIDTLNAELRVTVENPEVAQKINELGYTVSFGSPDEGAALIKSDTEAMKKLIDAGVFKLSQ